MITRLSATFPTNFELDSNADLMPIDNLNDVQVRGVWDKDSNGDIQPAVSGYADQLFDNEQDGTGVMPS